MFVWIINLWTEMDRSSLQQENIHLRQEISKLQQALHTSQTSSYLSQYHKLHKIDIIPTPYAPSMSIDDEVERLKLSLNKISFPPENELISEVDRLRSENEALRRKILSRRKLRYCERCDALLSLGLSTRQCERHGSQNNMNWLTIQKYIQL